MSLRFNIKEKFRKKKKVCYSLRFYSSNMLQNLSFKKKKKKRICDKKLRNIYPIWIVAITLWSFMKLVIVDDQFYCYTTRAYSSYLMHVLVTRMRLPFFIIFSNFVHFCQNFQMFYPFCLFLPFFWKFACMPLLSRIGPDNLKWQM